MIGRDTDPHGELRALTKRLARLLASEAGTLALARMQRRALVAGPRAEPAPLETGLRLGIWAPEVQEDGSVEFVRSRALEREWRYWADVDRIPAKKGPRVVLLGESVARGYLFDPLVTPAAVLSTLLDGVEVVDLARTDLGLDGLRSLFEGLPALEPDAVVVFAGNNWYNVVFQLEDLQRLAAGLRSDGYAGCRRVFLDEIVTARCRSLLEALARSAGEFGLPVVVVVPEFNLLDWRGEPSVVAPVLRADANVRWLDARRRAEEALADGKPEEAARLALQLVALDGGTSSVGPALLASARPEEARIWLERARDAVVGIFLAHSPRCPAVVQAILREQSAEHGFLVVDLPRVFDAESRGALPGRELFIDYCHLTLTGMRVAMTEVARELVPLVGAVVQSDAPLNVPPEHEAVAHFLAAVHNAHYGQSDDILRHHCLKAATLSRSACEHMRLYLDCVGRWPEPWLSDSFARLCESPVVRRYMLAPEVRSQKLADFGVMEAVLGALEAVGIDDRTSVERLLKEEHGAAECVDLLNPCYRAFTFRDRGGYALAAERAYVRATDLRSRFAIVRAQAGLVRLQITCRAPSDGAVGISVNGEVAGTVPVRPVWQTSGLTVRVREGLNWIELEWPIAAQPPEELERAARRIERGFYPDVLPWYGEVHAFTAEKDPSARAPHG